MCPFLEIAISIMRTLIDDVVHEAFSFLPKALPCFKQFSCLLSQVISHQSSEPDKGTENLSKEEIQLVHSFSLLII